MAELTLVRHGQASFGSDDYDQLSHLGRQQSRWLGEYFASHGEGFDCAVLGDLKRHQQTFEAVCEGMGQEPDSLQMPGLNEFDFESLIKAYIHSYPDQAPGPDTSVREYYRLLKRVMMLWMADELEGELPESWAGFEDRVVSVLQFVQREYKGARVLAVSSGGAIAMAISHVLRCPSETVVELNLQQKNSGFAHMFFNEKAFRLTGFNHVPHLDSVERRQHITFS